MEEKDLKEKVSKKTIDFLLDHPNINRSKITNLKGRIAKKFNYDRVIKNATILDYIDSLDLTEKEEKLLIKKLRRRSTRSLSGVSVIAIMTEPLECPGNCIYCPGQESQPGEKVAKSYTGKEPAAMRSIHYGYDPYRQVKSRVEDLEAIGHSVDKIELIVMGGTFLSTSLAYQENFIKGALETIIDEKVDTLEEAKKLAENSERRLIGLTVETRPDYCKEKEIDRMLNFGTTRVEIGIQTLYDNVYKLVNRGHTTKDSIEAIRIAKDAGLKINTHMMPNLPGTSYQQDEEMFTKLFSNPDYRPDMLKIYPCLVIKGTELFDWWKEGTYRPYELDELITLIANVKKDLPPYVRIQRIMRDIPATLIEAGCKKSNLRQLVQQRLDSMEGKCHCIRCREYGIVKRKRKLDANSLDNIKLKRLDYEASKGQEIFLSFENDQEEYLVGYLRLRKPSEFAHRPELNNGKTMIVREIKVVGELVPKDLEPSNKFQIQHRGYGSLLLEEAERIAKDEFNSNKISVISGIGVRDWFFDKNYFLDGPYVSKRLR
jgi:elongator complex protein 3